MYTRLRIGEKPAAGSRIALVRGNRGVGGSYAEPTEVESFDTDGDWVCPATVNGFYYATWALPAWETEFPD